MIRSPMKITNTSNMIMNPMKALKERLAKRNSDSPDDDTMPPTPPAMTASKSDSFLASSVSMFRSPMSSKKSPKLTMTKTSSKDAINSPKRSNSKSTKNAVFPVTVSAPSIKSPKKAKKAVRFEPKQDQVHRVVPRLSSITPSDKQQLWFDSTEFHDMRDECERTAEKLNNGKEVKDKKYSAVGLEGWTKKGREARTIHKADAWDAVFEEQYAGYTQGRRVSMNVSAAYQKASEDAKLRAVEVAMGIHHDVEKFLMKNDGSLRRLLMTHTGSQDDNSLHFSAEMVMNNEEEARRRGSL